MSLEKSYETLFATLREIVESEPEKAPELLAVILAGGPFRPVLERPVLLNKVALMAKQFVAERRKTDAPRSTSPADAGGSVPTSSGGALSGNARRAPGPAKP